MFDGGNPNVSMLLGVRQVEVNVPGPLLERFVQNKELELLTLHDLLTLTCSLQGRYITWCWRQTRSGQESVGGGWQGSGAGICYCYVKGKFSMFGWVLQYWPFTDQVKTLRKKIADAYAERLADNMTSCVTQWSRTIQDCQSFPSILWLMSIFDCLKHTWWGTL